MRKYFLIIAIAIAATACNNETRQNSTTENRVKEQETATTTPASGAGLAGKEWKLLELNGKPVVPDTTFPKYPHIRFETGNRISGNLGCNSFGGNYRTGENNGIELQDISATMMACPNLQVEQAFLDALKSAKAFRINNDTLALSNEKQEITARLKAQ